MMRDGVATVQYGIQDTMGNVIEYREQEITLSQLSAMFNNPDLWGMSAVSLYFDGPKLMLTWYDSLNQRGNWLNINAIKKDASHGEQQARQAHPGPGEGSGDDSGRDGAEGSGGLSAGLSDSGAADHGDFPVWHAGH